jgi:hypothetical protein
MRHHLTSPSTGETWTATITGSTLKIERCDAKGKSKTSEKKFANSKAANEALLKQEWELLRKKGMILRQPDADPGEPQLHVFIGDGYTGCLSLVGTPHGTFVYQLSPGNTSRTPIGSNDYLAVIDEQGNKIDTLELPQPLAWDIAYDRGSDSLFVDADHVIYQYSIRKKSFTRLTPDQSTSFISVENGIAAYASEPNLFVRDVAKNKQLYSGTFECELYGGHTPQLCGALSKSGKVLAMSTCSGNIQITDAATGKPRCKIAGQFQMVKQMEFAKDDRWLMILELYGSNGLHMFDAASGKVVASPLETPKRFTADHFCFDAAQKKVAVLDGTAAYVFAFPKGRLLHLIHLAHCVKRARAAFIGDALAVRTDRGCYSLYKV